jgi:hypothetical protein
VEEIMFDGVEEKIRELEWKRKLLGTVMEI